MKLKDKVVLITGGGSGLGRETGLTFAREGAKVGINDVRPESAQNVVTEIERAGSKGAKAFVADVSNSTAVKKMFADFDRRGLSPAERRREIFEKHAKKA